MKRLILAATLLTASIAVAEETALPSANVSSDILSMLPTEGGALHVLVDDIDGNGRPDLAFTSHGNSDIQVYKQIAPRRFEASSPQAVTGFHPNDTIALPGTPKRYLINAEGEGKLKVVRAQPDGRFELVAERAQPAPRASTPFFWPGWDLSLAVVPYNGKTLTLLRGFNPETGDVKSVYQLEIGIDPKHVRLADLNGDGIDELVLTTLRGNELWVIDYPGPDKNPTPRRLWSFERGWPRHVLPFDVDRNGTVDLLVPMSVRQETVVLLNDGKGHFTEGKPIPYPVRPGIHVMTTGQDRDGTRYMLAGGIKALVLYREIKDAPGNFENTTLSLATWPNWVELKDIDGDGWLDAVAAIQGGGALSPVIYGPLWEAFTTLSASKKAE